MLDSNSNSKLFVPWKKETIVNSHFLKYRHNLNDKHGLIGRIWVKKGNTERAEYKPGIDGTCLQFQYYLCEYRFVKKHISWQGGKKIAYESVDITFDHTNGKIDKNVAVQEVSIFLGQYFRKLLYRQNGSFEAMLGHKLGFFFDVSRQGFCG